jgi:hypothetical protein
LLVAILPDLPPRPPTTQNSETRIVLLVVGDEYKAIRNFSLIVAERLGYLEGRRGSWWSAVKPCATTYRTAPVASPTGASMRVMA